MKRVIILTVYCLIPLTVLRAQLSHMQIIGKPERLTSEIVSVRDVNGRFCAAVKIISDMEGFSYDSYNGVVRVDDQPGKDMVFLSPDERVLEILHTGYAPLKIILSEIGIQLREREVWKIEISGEKKLGEISIGIISHPEGAEIFMDGESRGTERQQVVAVGSHQIRLSKPGYAPVIQTIYVDEKNTLFEFTLEEQEDVNVRIVTEPAGAEVYIDDVKLGVTPINNFYPAGRYNLRIEKAWHVTYEDMIDIQPPATQKTFVLQENFVSIEVTSSPETGLDIYINEEIQNYKTPHIFTRLKPGTYTIRAQSRFYETSAQEVVLKRGENRKIQLIAEGNFAVVNIRTRPEATVTLNGSIITELNNIRLEPSVILLKATMAKAEPVEKRLVLRRNETYDVDLMPEVATGTLQIAPVPFDAKIILRGDAGEFYESTGAKIFKDIPAGTYTVTVSHRDFKAVKETITLSKGDKITREIALSKSEAPFNTEDIQKPSTREISYGFSRGKVVLQSALIPGLGQINNERRTGWLYAGLTLAGAAFYGYGYLDHQDKLDQYHELKDAYMVSGKLADGLKAQSAKKEADQSYETTMTTAYVLGGIYVINLMDALLFKPKADQHANRIQVLPEWFCFTDMRPVPALKIKVTL